MNHLAAYHYLELRRQRQDVPAVIAWNFVNGEYPEAQNVDQAMCRHKWVINGESDRCYCCYCGADGDA